METSFTTQVAIHPLKEPMGYLDNWMSLGSCFAENIGLKLRNAGFNTLLNPFGVLFNPLSIEKALRRLIENRPVGEEELFQYGSLWNHFQFSNLHSGTDREATLQSMNESIAKATTFLNSTNVLLLTFGTAWIYETTTDGEVVANCHKLSSVNFKRRRLSVAEIVKTYTSLINDLPQGIRIVLTVSPVRHWKDGAHENTLSKSTLHLAISEIIEHFPDRVFYFPAYEIVIDELRDYRFYNDDFIHPSTMAIRFLWGRFVQFAFSDETRNIIGRVEKFKTMISHRPIHPESNEFMLFQEKIVNERQLLLSEFPFLIIES